MAAAWVPTTFFLTSHYFSSSFQLLFHLFVFYPLLRHPRGWIEALCVALGGIERIFDRVTISLAPRDVVPNQQTHNQRFIKHAFWYTYNIVHFNWGSDKESSNFSGPETWYFAWGSMIGRVIGCTCWIDRYIRKEATKFICKEWGDLFGRRERFIWEGEFE